MPFVVREHPIAVVFTLKIPTRAGRIPPQVADWRYVPITIAFPPRADNLGLTGDEGE
jgi:hypothetical protein